MLATVHHQQHPGLFEEEIRGQKGVAGAHHDRITGMAYHKNCLYTVSRDGSLKVWDASDLTLRKEVKDAHKGAFVTCVCIGPDNFLYTGGADNVRPHLLFRRKPPCTWTPVVLEFAYKHELRRMRALKIAKGVHELHSPFFFFCGEGLGRISKVNDCALCFLLFLVMLSRSLVCSCAPQGALPLAILCAEFSEFVDASRGG